MRPKQNRSLPPSCQGLVHVNKTCPASEHQLAVSRPSWASFEMENSFWDAMEEICNAHSLDFKTFIEQAQDQHPNTPLATAVRIEVIEHFRAQAGFSLGG